MDNFIGEIRPFAGNYAPQNWALCDGRKLPISGNEALYSLLGVRFGGDGVSNFGLPDLRGNVAVGAGLGPGLSNRPFASSGGAESVALSADEAPAHSHAFMVTTDAATASSPAGNLFANPSPNNFYATTPGQGMPPQVLKADSVTAAGGGQSHENRMPTLAVTYIIALTGIYPSQQ